MTGIADFYLYMKRPHSKDRRQRFLAHFLHQSSTNQEPQRFVVLSWKRTGSNLLCGMLHLHPEILMHNELFNPIDIFTYHPTFFRGPSSHDNDPNNSVGACRADSWSVLTRDLFPEDFLDFIWYGHQNGLLGTPLASSSACKAIGFKSFPEHWSEVRNDAIFQRALMEDIRVKKIILHRQDELAVYVSMLRADQTGRYMTHAYPDDLTLHIDPAQFQQFLDHYRDTFARKYKSPTVGRDTFCITYEQLCGDATVLEEQIMPQLFQFLGVDPTAPVKRLKETVKQANPQEDLATVIQNYDQLEFCFRYSNLVHFVQRIHNQQTTASMVDGQDDAALSDQDQALDSFASVDPPPLASWSILLPICSRTMSKQTKPRHMVNQGPHDPNTKEQHNFSANRFLDLTLSSQYDEKSKATVNHDSCWAMLQEFAETLEVTACEDQLSLTEIIIGIDIDDVVYQNDEAKDRLAALMPCRVVFVPILPEQYGKLCRIWNHLGKMAEHDFLVLLGDDVRLLDKGWQGRIVQCFHRIAKKNPHLPFGAACVAMNDLSFPGFPTFPVVHRWHVKTFGSILPKQFVNQGGDPYLYELYSRFNAAEFVQTCRLENTIGGDGDARYQKYHINWRGHILNMGLRRLKSHLVEPTSRHQQQLQQYPQGIVMDVVIPSYRTNNNDILERIVNLRASVDNVYVKFWIVVDNPLTWHVDDVKDLARRCNEKQLQSSNNYFINVIHYTENRGASYARNTGYNYSTADWILFLDDDVVPEKHLLDAYLGALQRYPDAKVFVGHTELPPTSHNAWTEMLRTCNVGYFYGIAQKMVHPPWGVTANLLVRGSRYNPTIQFKSLYPKTGGGEDIDLVYQYKAYYPSLGRRVTVGVPEARVHHPWWRNGQPCYGQITGWATGDSLCITEWPEKTFVVFPNWIEHVVFVVLPLSLYTKRPLAGLMAASAVIVWEHILKAHGYWVDAKRVVLSQGGPVSGGGGSQQEEPATPSNLVRRWWWQTAWVALGAGSIISSQEATRTWCLLKRFSLFSLCRRVDWFDGQKPTIKLDIQLGSAIRCVMNTGLTWWAWSSLSKK